MSTTIATSALTAGAAGSLQSDDVLAILDVHDLSQAASGSLRKTTLVNLYRTETTPVTVSTPLPDIRQAWNNAGVVFTAFKLNIIDTASAVGSLLHDLQVGGVSKWSVDKAGNVVQVGTLSVAAGITGNLIVRPTGTAGDAWLDLVSTGSGHYNWQVGKSLTAASSFQITPSTAADGTTFTTPVLSLTPAGALSLPGNVAAGTFTLQVTAPAGAANRDILAAGHSGFSNGFQVQSTGGVLMLYTMNNGNLTVSGDGLSGRYGLVTCDALVFGPRSIASQPAGYWSFGLQAATANAGAAGAPPAQVAGYLDGFFGSTRIKIPYYLN